MISDIRAVSFLDGIISFGRNSLYTLDLLGPIRRTISVLVSSPADANDP